MKITPKKILARTILIGIVLVMVFGIGKLFIEDLQRFGLRIILESLGFVLTLFGVAIVFSWATENA